MRLNHLMYLREIVPHFLYYFVGPLNPNQDSNQNIFINVPLLFTLRHASIFFDPTLIPTLSLRGNMVSGQQTHLIFKYLFFLIFTCFSIPWIYNIDSFNGGSHHMFNKKFKVRHYLVHICISFLLLKYSILRHKG